MNKVIQLGSLVGTGDLLSLSVPTSPLQLQPLTSRGGVTCPPICPPVATPLSISLSMIKPRKGIENFTPMNFINRHRIVKRIGGQVDKVVCVGSD